MCTVLALEDAGVAPGDMTIEVIDPILRGGKLDLVELVGHRRRQRRLRESRAGDTGHREALEDCTDLTPIRPNYAATA